jgi:hypothetical protein
VPITSTQSGGALNGVFTSTNFAVNSAGQLVANGNLTGTLTDALGNVTNLVDLLGNLLCAVTHLLDNTGASNKAIQNLVNILNGLLGGL